jgi:transglutaminase-like putative cysteine protease
MLAAEPLAAGLAELTAAGSVTYRISQRFRYDYDGPAHDLVHRLIVIPPDRRADQRLRLHAVEVSEPAARLHWSRDRWGNRVATVRLAQVPSRLDFTVSVVAERAGGTDPPFGRGVELTRPTRLTAPDGAIRELAGRAGAAGDPYATVLAANAAVHRAIRYEFGVTGVGTTAAAALAGGRGVCQDSAHVLLAVLRACGLAARYVSGHLLGEGGTHAWVEAAVGGRALAVDPCNDRLADRRYVTVATGRDYADVAPTSGSYRGPGRSALTCGKRVDVVALGN